MALRQISRRRLLQVGVSSAGGLLLGVGWAPSARPIEEGESSGPGNSSAATLNAFVGIEPNGRVTLKVPLQELGQGVRTALPRIVAEELEVDWQEVQVLQAGVDPQYGGMVVGGSDSVTDYWEPLRQAGAAAREMLLEAAARRWGVNREECRAEGGVVHYDAGGKRASFGSLAREAAALPVPEEPPLKAPEAFRLIGEPVRSVDSEAIVTGTAIYGSDVMLPGMLYAVIARPPVLGGKAMSVDDSAARTVDGVRGVLRLEPVPTPRFGYGSVAGGVAVLAENPWGAIRGREALRVRWEGGQNPGESTARIGEAFLLRKDSPGEVEVRREGDAEKALSEAAIVLEAEYEFPVLAHACMEPLSFVADVSEHRCEMRGSTQDPRRLQALVAEALGLPAEAVEIKQELAGGGFGRRLALDYGLEAAILSKRVGAPVKVLWTREDDFTNDFYRTPSFHRVLAGLDEQGSIVAWRHHLLTASLRRQLAGRDSEHPALYDVEGAANHPYSFPNILVEYTPVDVGLQVGSWRSVSHSFNVFVVNSFLDEIAAAVGRDPYEFQMELLGGAQRVELELALPGRRGRPAFDRSRLRRVLRTAAQTAGWGVPMGRGRGRGIACCYFKNTYAAHVAEVEVLSAGEVHVRRVVAVLDCGLVINPDGVRAQIEGGAIDGVATVLKWGATVEGGRVQQDNFDDYELVSIAEVPEIVPVLVPSAEPPSGAGEPPYPSVAPAIANAIFDAVGKRVRRLPIRRAELRT